MAMIKGGGIFFYLPWLCLVLILSCSSDLKDRVEIYEKAHNNHDVEGALSCFTEDFVFEVSGHCIAEYKYKMRELEEWDAAINSQFTFTDVKIFGDTVVCKLIERNDWFRLAGIDAIYYDSIRITFRNGLIEAMEAEQNEKSIIAAQEAFQSFIEWAAEEHSYELAELMYGIEFVFSKDNADRWLSLLREWRKKTLENSADHPPDVTSRVIYTSRP